MSTAVNQPTVQNVVSFARLIPQHKTNGVANLDLNLIAQKVSGSRYNKKRFPAVIIRKTKPKTTVLIFKSGAMILIGSQSEQDAHLNAKRVAKDIKNLTNSSIKLHDFRVSNIVANANFGNKINIGKLAEIQGQRVSKDENFPGAIYKIEKPIKTALIFNSGKVVFTGAEKRTQINEAFEELRKNLRPYFIVNDN